MDLKRENFKQYNFGVCLKPEITVTETNLLRSLFLRVNIYFPTSKLSHTNTEPWDIEVLLINGREENIYCLKTTTQEQTVNQLRHILLQQIHRWQISKLYCSKTVSPVPSPAGRYQVIYLFTVVFIYFISFDSWFLRQ